MKCKKKYSAGIKQLEFFSNRKSIINCLKACSHKEHLQNKNYKDNISIMRVMVSFTSGKSSVSTA